MFREASRNLTAMLYPDQEIEVGDSYFSHFRAFGFSPKSPYSATAVPYLYNLIHLVGAYMGDNRSLNAVAMQDAAINQMAILAGYIGEYFVGSGDYGLFVGQDALADQTKSAITGARPARKRSPALLSAVLLI